VIAIVFSIFMMILDVLVAFIQAYVFTLLSALYFASAKHP
jgi:F-type H+-transporting ATPase subunit a